MKILKNKRYIYDPLYGVIDMPDYIWDVIISPELQRLREVRLCNINSLCLIGGANINRYEHAIGTCYLAKECISSWSRIDPISEKEQQLILLAALLHDTASAPFGHSVEYIESKEGYEHDAFKNALTGKNSSYPYRSATLEPIFFGLGREILSKVAEDDINKIDEIIRGKGKFGRLINSAIDLDNLDNVFRLAYHIGIVKSGKIPLQLAKSLYIANNELILRQGAGPLIEEWYNIRKKLYLLLLQNPDEFSAKCMLTDAIELAKIKSSQSFRWFYVDYEFLKKLSEVSEETNNIISRLMKGDLYGCIGIFSTEKTDHYPILSDPKRRKMIEDELSEIIQSKFKQGPQLLPELFPALSGGFEESRIETRRKFAMLSLHSIIDVNKTERQVIIRTDDGKIIQIGKPSKQLLIGVFFRNVGLSMYKLYSEKKPSLPHEILAKIRKEIITYLAKLLNDLNLKEIELFSEGTSCE